MLSHAVRSRNAGAAWSTNQFRVRMVFFPVLCFHQFVRTKLALDAQIEMYTAPFLWFYKIIDSLLLLTPPYVWCSSLNRRVICLKFTWMRVRFIHLSYLLLAVLNHEVKRKVGRYLKKTHFYKTMWGHLVKNSFLIWTIWSCGRINVY